MLEQYVPIFLVLAFAIGFAIVVVWSSKLVGPQRPTAEKLSTYESGVQPVGSTHERVSVKYYLVAMFFIIFDLEVIFVYPWAVEFKRLYGALGLSAFYSMLVFLVVFEIGFLYAYKKGGFKWD
ncbi:MAG: NADH-quinone oxidoreductase subunit A [Ignavibacteriales bacterium]|nr:NADH-quinone oxidoreductase subunit A [Ignavibacteriales bacterium]